MLPYILKIICQMMTALTAGGTLQLATMKALQEEMAWCLNGGHVEVSQLLWCCPRSEACASDNVAPLPPSFDNSCC